MAMIFPIPHFYLGLDLGQRCDFSALAAIEYRPGGLPHYLSPWTNPPHIYELRQLQRALLGTPYPEVVERVARFVAPPDIAGRATLAVDATGVGAPVIDLIRNREMDCSLLPVIITGGERGRLDRGYQMLPKRDLIVNLELMLERSELTIAGQLPNRARLVEELMNMRAKSLRAENGNHDDLVLAVALAAWAARRFNSN
jgi:hypothetical protein